MITEESSGVTAGVTNDEILGGSFKGDRILCTYDFPNDPSHSLTIDGENADTVIELGQGVQDTIAIADMDGAPGGC